MILKLITEQHEPQVENYQEACDAKANLPHGMKIMTPAKFYNFIKTIFSMG